MRQSLNGLCAGTGAKWIVDVDRTQMHAGQNGGRGAALYPAEQAPVTPLSPIRPSLCRPDTGSRTHGLCEYTRHGGGGGNGVDGADGLGGCGDGMIVGGNAMCVRVCPESAGV